MKVSAYIPCFNNRGTIARAIESVKQQRRAVDEFFVVDNGSSDGSAEFVASLGVRVIPPPETRGRGASRALAMKEAAHELVLCCDAAIVLEPDFITNAMPWFEDRLVAAVFGWVTQPPPVNAVERWRGRHLFKGSPEKTIHHAALATGGALMRALAVKETGNFNAHLEYGEDADLGDRLLGDGWDIICDPQLKITSIAENTLAQVLERYWRWNTASHGRMSVREYVQQISYSVKVMARQDLQAGDPLAAAISLITPHYQFLKAAGDGR